MGALRPVGEDVVDATPSQAVLSFDHEVTQWMSRVNLVRGSALNSAQLHALPDEVRLQRESPVGGLDPRRRAGRKTGKLSTRCCPGGSRSDSSGPDWRPVKPRVTMVDFLRRLMKGASSRWQMRVEFVQRTRPVANTSNLDKGVKCRRILPPRHGQKLHLAPDGVALNWNSGERRQPGSVSGPRWPQNPRMPSAEDGFPGRSGAQL